MTLPLLEKNGHKLHVPKKGGQCQWFDCGVRSVGVISPHQPTSFCKPLTSTPICAFRRRMDSAVGSPISGLLKSLLGQNGSVIEVVVCGNKCDLERHRQVSQEDAVGYGPPYPSNPPGSWVVDDLRWGFFLHLVVRPPPGMTPPLAGGWRNLVGGADGHHPSLFESRDVLHINAAVLSRWSTASGQTRALLFTRISVYVGRGEAEGNSNGPDEANPRGAKGVGPGGFPLQVLQVSGGGALPDLRQAEQERGGGVRGPDPQYAFVISYERLTRASHFKHLAGTAFVSAFFNVHYIIRDPIVCLLFREPSGFILGR